MRLFHQTKTQDAESIWNDGFRDLEVIVDDGCAGEKFVGVRLFDNSIGWNPNPDGNNLLLTIEIPEDAISAYEWVTGDSRILCSSVGGQLLWPAGSGRSRPLGWAFGWH